MKNATRPDLQFISHQRITLLDRIHRRYQTITELVHVGPHAFSFTRIADPNRVLDEVAEEEDRRDKVAGRRRPSEQLHLPYWAELWDSALGMGSFLVRQTFISPQLVSAIGRQNDFHKKMQVMDLGCGMGFTGMVAARLGADVLFADLESPPLLFARLNSLPDAHRVRTRRVNWQTDQISEQFDIILGCDIVYERSQWEFLHAFWQRHLALGGHILLAEPGRQTGDLFIPWAASKGWTLEQFEEPLLSRPKPIRLFQLTGPA